MTEKDNSQKEKNHENISIDSSKKDEKLDKLSNHKNENNESDFTSEKSDSDSSITDYQGSKKETFNIDEHEKQLEAFGLYNSDNDNSFEDNEQEDADSNNKDKTAKKSKGNWPGFLQEQRGQNIFAWSSLIYCFMGGINFVSIIMGLYFFLYLDGTREKSVQAKIVFVFSMIIAAYNTYRYYF